MILDAIKNQKCLVTVSGYGADTDLSLTHPAWSNRPAFQWMAPANGWICFNFIIPVDFQNATIQYTGSPDLIHVEGSNDAFTWYPLGKRDGQWLTFDVDGVPLYDGTTSFTMYRLRVESVADVLFTEFTLNGEHNLSAVADRFLTPQASVLWPQKYFESYPFLPSTLKTYMEMLEGEVSELVWPYGAPSIQGNTLVCDGLTNATYTWESATQVYSSNNPTALIPDPIRCVIRDKQGRIFEALV